MSEITFIIIFTILSILNAVVLFFTRRERIIVKKAETEIADDVVQITELSTKFYNEIEEFISAVEKATDKTTDKIEQP
jgi:DNA replication initiation complex subunit (GINS family)